MTGRPIEVGRVEDCGCPGPTESWRLASTCRQAPVRAGRCWSSCTAADGWWRTSRPTISPAASWRVRPACACCRSTTAWHRSIRSPPRSMTPCRRFGSASSTGTGRRRSGRVAIGGDSAGGNLAAVVAQLASRDGGPAPAFQLLIYPVMDLSRKRRSYQLFGDGLFLTERQMDWYRDQYLPEAAAALDPRASPLLSRRSHGPAAGARRDRGLRRAARRVRGVRSAPRPGGRARDGHPRDGLHPRILQRDRYRPDVGP